jgi:hypothetical protein
LEVDEMLFMGRSTIPLTSVQDFMNKAMETLASNPYPEFTKRNYYIRFIDDEIEMTTIYDIDKGNEEEALLDICNRAYPFFHCVEGLKGNTFPVMTLEQLFAMLSSQQQEPSA